mgnify:CR=1 FL=1
MLAMPLINRRTIPHRQHGNSNLVVIDTSRGDLVDTGKCECALEIDTYWVEKVYTRGWYFHGRTGPLVGKRSPTQ